MNSKLWLHITSSTVASAGAVLIVGDKLIAMPGLPGWLVSAWPLVMFLSALIDRVGSAIIDANKPQGP